MPVGGDVLDALRTLAERQAAAVVNLCDDLPGSSAHEMHFAGALELLGVPYSGAPPLALGLCRDKAKTKQILRAHGLPTPAYSSRTARSSPSEGLRFPLIAKPATEDGSLGITDASVATDEVALRRAVADTLERYGPVLVEEYIDGGSSTSPSSATIRRGCCRSPRSTSPACRPATRASAATRRSGSRPTSASGARWGGALRPWRRPRATRIERWSLLAFRALGCATTLALTGASRRPAARCFSKRIRTPDISPGSGFMRSWREAGNGYRELVRRSSPTCSVVRGPSSPSASCSSRRRSPPPPRPGAGFRRPTPVGARLVREKRYPLALESLRLLARQIQDARLGEVVQAFPEAPPGWTATPVISLLADDEIWSSRLVGRRTYLRESGALKVDLTIDIRSPLAPAAAMGLNPVFANADPRRACGRGGPARPAAPLSGRRRGELRILVGREALVTITGRGIAGDQRCSTSPAASTSPSCARAPACRESAGAALLLI